MKNHHVAVSSLVRVRDQVPGRMVRLMKLEIKHKDDDSRAYLVEHICLLCYASLNQQAGRHGIIGEPLFLY